MILTQASVWNVGTCALMEREKSKWEVPMEDESTKARHRGGVTRSSEEGPVMGLEQRGGIIRLYKLGQPFWEEPGG